MVIVTKKVAKVRAGGRKPTRTQIVKPVPAQDRKSASRRWRAYEDTGGKARSYSRSHGLGGNRKPRHGRKLVRGEAHVCADARSVGIQVVVVAKQGTHRMIVVRELELAEVPLRWWTVESGGRAGLGRRCEANVDTCRRVQVGHALRRTHVVGLSLDRLHEVRAGWQRVLGLPVGRQAVWEPGCLRRSGRTVGVGHRCRREEQWLLLAKSASVLFKAGQVLRTERTSLHGSSVRGCRTSRLSTLCARDLTLESRRGAAHWFALGILAETRGGDDALLESLVSEAPERAFLMAVKRRGSDALEGLRKSLAPMKVDNGGRFLMAYCVHAEVVANAVLPASAGRVSRLLAVLADPRVHILE